MENKKDFDPKAFLETKVYEPIQDGKHKVTLLRFINGIKEEKPYVAYEIKLENDRVVTVRWYDYGMQILFNQLRAQTGDSVNLIPEGERINRKAFFSSLNGTQVDCYISKRSYLSPEGTEKHTLQYDFTEPREAAAAVV